MRTLQEKYNAVLEGNFSKEQFRRDAAMQLPNIVSKFNSFEDTATILKNRGMIAEAAKPAHSSEYAKTDAKPEDHISLDLIDAGIKCELDEKFGRLDVSEEDYENAKATAIKNLSKDPLYYIKKDSEEMPEMGEKMEKAKLHEETALDRAQDNAATKVQNALGDIADTVAEKPASVAAAFKKMVLANPVKYAKMSKEELEKEFEAFKLEEGHGENPKKFKESDKFEPGKFYIKDLKSGRILNAISTQGSKIVFYYDTEADAQAQADWITRWEGDPGRFEVLPGTDPEVEALVNKQTGVQDLDQLTKDQQDHDEETLRRERGLEEQQLKEAIKKLITKVIAE